MWSDDETHRDGSKKSDSNLAKDLVRSNRIVPVDMGVPTT